MGSEGYFINQFIASHTNKRTDEFGGSYENRIRLPIEVVKQVRDRVGPNFIIIYRLSMLDLIEDGSSWKKSFNWRKPLSRRGHDYQYGYRLARSACSDHCNHGAASGIYQSDRQAKAGQDSIGDDQPD